VAAGVVRFRRGGLLVATLNAVLYGGIGMALPESLPPSLRGD
jgi:hypothetical protein